jgi:serine phosphatase RsbU (regulator of sigma subunit)
LEHSNRQSSTLLVVERDTDVSAEVAAAVLLAPAGEESAGGDFHHVHRAGPLTVVVVGDVMGKGQSAAPYAERTLEWVRECVGDAADPAAMLEQLNTLVYTASGFDRFVTVSAVAVDAAVRSASWAFAGHLPPVWLDTGTPVDGATPGFPLGLGPVCGARSAQTRPLRPGEGFALFTDGLEDVVGPGGDRFGIARISHTLAVELRGATPERVVHGLKRAACAFGDERLYDDICIAALRLT